MSWTESHGFSTFGQYNLTLLGVDQAWLNITNNLENQTLWLYELSKDCLGCPHVINHDVAAVKAGASKEIIVSTKFPLNYRLERDGATEIIRENENGGFIRNLHCQVDTSMGEFGIYELNAQEDGCEFVTVLKPVSIFLPFLIPFFFYLGLAAVIFILKKYKTQIFRAVGLGKKSNETDAVLAVSSVRTIDKPTAPAPPASKRLSALDTFRGISIVVMMFVHDGRAGYYFLDHATWDGLFVADLVFPWFLWIMGVCIPVSIKSQVKRDTPKLTILKRIIIRSIKLIAIGIMLNSKGGPIEFATLRLPGVLQRFGICYFVTATCVLICADKGCSNNNKPQNKYLAMVQDILIIWKGWVIVLACVVLHTCLTFFLKVPGCPTGYLGPGGLHDGAKYPGECVGGASGYIDRQILTMNHIYQWPTAKGTYRSIAYDPEGLLGTLTSILTVWLGVQVGLILQVYPKHKSRLIRWAIWAVVLGAIGAALCGAKQTGGAIPLNKNLWSLSFVLVLSSFALILLMVLYVTIDMLKIWSGTPFREPGMNSILLYVAHLVMNDMLPFHFRLKTMNTHFKLLAESLWSISLWVIYAIYLFHKKFFWNL
ncbi:Heparan-alpha-glucosaminide N-acetyltransferase [Orchesella cincta]|uniref:Heparan-alpha-glucosaminide N-acetyltransferase n=1 Tax=Orchesella cincta TaxID=48709 RepID=A0A1D2NFW1_ORCCI|nr:Heparan-alpha-glucosaminide N-acetyltransferase [Orchesella cincta]